MLYAIHGGSVMPSVPERFGKPKVILALLVGVFGVIFLGGFILRGLVIVENRKAAILIRKTGEDLKSGDVLALGDQKGIQHDPLPEGWYWRNPYTWDTIEVDQVEIPQGKIGI